MMRLVDILEDDLFDSGRAEEMVLESLDALERF